MVTRPITSPVVRPVVSSVTSPGVVASVAHFDGATGYISVTGLGAQVFPYGYEAVIKPVTTPTGFQGVSSICNTAIDSGYLAFGTEDNSTTYRIDRRNSTNIITRYTPPAVNVKKTIKIMFLSETSFQIWIDGISFAHETGQVAVPSTGLNAMAIGCLRLNTPAVFFTGEMSNVKYWNNNILVSHWPLSTNAVDIIGSNDGNILGGVTFGPPA